MRVTAGPSIRAADPPAPERMRAGAAPAVPAEVPSLTGLPDANSAGNGNARSNGHANGNGHADGNGRPKVAADVVVPDAMPGLPPSVRVDVLTRATTARHPLLRLASRIVGAELLPSIFALLLGTAATLYVRGYNFGESNQTIYLLGGLRDSAPWLLRHDWLVSQTTQYHVTFGALTRWLMRAGILESGFLVGYVLLVFLSQLAWLKLVRRLGGTHVTYLVSVLLYYLSNGGLGIGATEMFQDGAFLPSNVANVAMLWGIYLWVTGRAAGSAVALGVAGAFHLNHAVMATGLWTCLCAWQWAAPDALAAGRPQGPTTVGGRTSVRALLLRLGGGLAVILSLSLPNIVPVLLASRAAKGGPVLSLAEYVDTFVRLRAPHHFDPRSWPLALWLGFLWPVPLAVLAVRMAPMTPARRQACRVFLILCAAMAVSLVGAGIWYVSEPLIQMSFYRFSIYPKVLSCIGAAYWLGKQTLPARKQARFGIAAAVTGTVVVAAVVLNSTEIAPLELLHQATRPARALVFLSAVTVLCGCTAVGWLRRVRTPFYAAGLLALAIQLSAAPRWLGHEKLTPREENYLALCTWARDTKNTQIDAVFLVPPNEEPFRYEAQRAIVVNFKGVPPLRGELPEWRDRLKAVLDLPDLKSLPAGMTAASEAIRDRYEAMPPAYLAGVAKQYGARYLVLSRTQAVDPAAVVYENGSYRLCDVTRI